MEQIPSIDQYASHVARKRINTMLRSNIRDPQVPDVGEDVYFWRDGEGWLGPSTVQEVNPHGVRILHNGHIKNSSLNRIRSLQAHSTRDDPPLDQIVDVDGSKVDLLHHDDEADADNPAVDSAGLMTPLVSQETTKETSPAAIDPEKPSGSENGENIQKERGDYSASMTKSWYPIRASEVQELQKESTDFIQNLDCTGGRMKNVSGIDPDQAPTTGTHLTL